MVFQFDFPAIPFDSISHCRPFVAKIEAAIQSERDDRDAELAKNLRKADFESIMAKVEKDFDLLQKHLQPSEARTDEHALDMKYLRDRQQPLFTCSVRERFSIYYSLLTPFFIGGWMETW